MMSAVALKPKDKVNAKSLCSQVSTTLILAVRRLSLV